MCTVTYLPLNHQSWLLTSNRDESPLRPALIPAVYEAGQDNRLLYPMDPLAGGTWIAVSGKARAGCVLNGAFERHDRKPPYRKSRGLILLDLFAHNDVDVFFRDYDLDNIEPFTMVVINDARVYDFRWDRTTGDIFLCLIAQSRNYGHRQHYTPMSGVEKRHRWFEDWPGQGILVGHEKPSWIFICMPGPKATP